MDHLYNAHLANALPVIFSARPSWDLIPQEMIHMPARQMIAKSHAPRLSSEPTFAILCSKTFWTEQLVEEEANAITANAKVLVLAKRFKIS